MTTIDDLIASAAPRTQEVRVCARGDLAVRHEEIVRELNQWLTVEGDDALAATSTTRALHEQLAAVASATHDDRLMSFAHDGLQATQTSH